MGWIYSWDSEALVERDGLNIYLESRVRMGLDWDVNSLKMAMGTTRDKDKTDVIGRSLRKSPIQIPFSPILLDLLRVSSTSVLRINTEKQSKSDDDDER